MFSTNTQTYQPPISNINAASVGLGHVANLAPSDLPISDASHQAINNIIKTSLGLGNVANTAPSDLPISAATQQALNNISKTS